MLLGWFEYESESGRLVSLHVVERNQQIMSVIVSRLQTLDYVVSVEMPPSASLPLWSMGHDLKITIDHFHQGFELFTYTKYFQLHLGQTIIQSQSIQMSLIPVYREAAGVPETPI